MEITIEKKRPVRFKDRVRRILRYMIALQPWFTFRLLDFAIKIHGKTEKKAYYRMQKYKLLTNYNK